MVNPTRAISEKRRAGRIGIFPAPLSSVPEPSSYCCTTSAKLVAVTVTTTSFAVAFSTFWYA